jgi:Arc/MetJ-type ribon-helix-helix transcriptional regulator
MTKVDIIAIVGLGLSACVQKTAPASADSFEVRQDASSALCWVGLTTAAPVGGSRIFEGPFTSRSDACRAALHLAASIQRLIETDEAHELNSTDEFEGRERYLRIDNADLPPDGAAERIREAFGLARVRAG